MHSLQGAKRPGHAGWGPSRRRTRELLLRAQPSEKTMTGLEDDPDCKSNVTFHRKIPGSSLTTLSRDCQRTIRSHIFRTGERRARFLVPRTPFHHVCFAIDDPVKGPHLNGDLSVRPRSNYQPGILGTRWRGGLVPTHTRTLPTWAPPGRLGNGHSQYSARRT
ncbi:hypothetical protein CGRA01v4_11651 [Colletotrichum graminicola]|nr:hypothetical protein CGRA01v4_11651 [Colletotrichum graminicola]